MWPFSKSYPQFTLSQLRDEYDYIVVGGGTAGAVLANRLSAQGKYTVLLVERGPIANSWASRVPLLSSDFASDGLRTRKSLSTYQDNLGRPVELCTGSALGGTSRINQMIYSRGLPAEYDAWRDAGNPGWGWEDMKPYFLKSEHALYSDDNHSNRGEWRNRASEALAFPAFQQIVEASKEVRLPQISDINSPLFPAIGCASLHFTRDQRQHRSSTFSAFLPYELVVQRSSHLHIVTNTEVMKLNVQVWSGKRFSVHGVDLKSRSSPEQRSITAWKEVILCAGPLSSPYLLLLSGVGPADHLKEIGIPVIKDLPAVGSNLQDHFGVSVAYEVPVSHSLVCLQKRPWIFLIELLKYLVFGTGMLLAPIVQIVVFASSLLLDDRGMPRPAESDIKQETMPDIEIMPIAADSAENPDASRGTFSFLNILLHPRSKGTVRLSSANPSDPPLIDPRYLSNPADFSPLRASLKLSLRLRDCMVQQGYPLVDFDSGVPTGEDDASLDHFIRQRSRTTYHYSSTCRMGPDSATEDGGVVNEELLVHGFDNLRIADSSIFPWVLGTHLQAPTVAVAEKCADMILSKSSATWLEESYETSSSDSLVTLSSDVRLLPSVEYRWEKE
ncbi:hypothetical protein GYMLUDRAFT_174953 [Collybiopsis luxurians FD-317 M1]|uniref:Unplaced genomic scaffold GYMLUscaffold_53, whole genome shotgun sequence n=1 Tax=Collybiopsis luxurians FD-317 M1 TaxID=944289 RepID=A0A0D0AZ21_9AGAR|nr:hypothetical protein GYMLUDRAFT_174953 [Collybiopsis luxurians FD-317 M1]